MRLLTSILVFFLFSMNLYSQEKVELGNYIFVLPLETDIITNINGKDSIKEKRIHQPGYKITVVNIVNNNTDVIIQYWEWRQNNRTNTKTENRKFNNSFFGFVSDSINHTIPLKYFKIKSNLFLKVAKKYYNRWLPRTAGIYTVPYKLRFKDFDFEKDLNLGVSIGFPFRINRANESIWILEPNFGIGLTKINLNSKNSSVLEDRTANAFTVSGGLLIRFSENINFGMFLGKDILGNTDRNVNWKYNKKTWLGLGINISLNTTKEKNEEPGKQNNSSTTP